MMKLINLIFYRLISILCQDRLFTINHFRFWSTITSLDCSTYKGLRNFVVSHAKYNISHRDYPGGTEQKLSSVV